MASEVRGVGGENRVEFGGSIVSLRFGAFVFHPDRRQLFRDEAEVHLTPKAFDLLALLIQRAPAVVTKADIHARLWPDTFVSDATLAGLVKEVRRALGDDGVGEIVRTAHRVGFAFAPAFASPTSSPSTSQFSCWLLVGGRRIPLHAGPNVIGRDPEAAVWLDVPGVSRRHAQVTVEGSKAILEDLGSKNGTLLGNVPVRERATLRPADRIQVASETLIFHSSASGISTSTQPLLPGTPKSDD